jgi:hypothetical protein
MRTIARFQRPWPSVCGGAKVAASGPVRIETETNAEGRYTFLGMAPGMYTIEATFSGLEAVHGVRVLAK